MAGLPRGFILKKLKKHIFLLETPCDDGDGVILCNAPYEKIYKAISTML
jgi:hypothetical protein